MAIVHKSKESKYVTNADMVIYKKQLLIGRPGCTEIQSELWKKIPISMNTVGQGCMRRVAYQTPLASEDGMLCNKFD